MSCGAWVGFKICKNADKDGCVPWQWSDQTSQQGGLPMANQLPAWMAQYGIVSKLALSKGMRSSFLLTFFPSEEVTLTHAADETCRIWCGCDCDEYSQAQTKCSMLFTIHPTSATATSVGIVPMIRSEAAGIAFNQGRCTHPSKAKAQAVFTRSNQFH